MVRDRCLRCAAIVAFCIVLPLALACSRKSGEPEPLPSIASQSRLDKSIAAQTEAIGQHPEQVNDRGELPHQLRGRDYAEKGEHDQAISDFTEAIRLYRKVKGPYHDARLAETYSARGESYLQKRDYEKAIADYTHIIDAGNRFSPDITDVLAWGGFAAFALYRRGVCHDEKGDHAKAKADFQEAMRRAPELANNEDLKRRMNK